MQPDIRKPTVILAMAVMWFWADALLGGWRMGFAAYVDALSLEVIVQKICQCAFVVGGVLWVQARQYRR